MKFTKMHGLGNDFIVIWSEQGLHERASELAVKACDRHFGIGADGMVWIVPSEQADVKMRIINADGSEAEQCGNAIRCVAKYIFDRKFVDKKEMAIETIGAGIQQVSVRAKNGKATEVRVDMGEPILEGLRIPTTLDQEMIINAPIQAAGSNFRFTAVSMGNPHCVIEVDDVKSIDLHKLGSVIEHHPLFPSRTNVEFVQVHSPSSMTMRVWERGAGVTLACGTGACASLVAAHISGRANREATVSLPGGDLWIEWDPNTNHVWMTGPAVQVFSGVWEDWDGKEIKG